MKVLGFPVHVRPGFLFFMVLIVALYRDEFGFWLAGSIAVFTLLHELGHAVAARRAGAKAEISLDFLAGYASYSSPTELRRRTEAGIALAGPLTHVVAGVVALVALGANPLDGFTRDHSAATAAVFWAGVAIGLFNLIPVLPLDGGNVVTAGLDYLAPGRARRWMTYVSLAVTGATAVACAVVPGMRPFVVFVGLLLIMQLQAFFEEREQAAVSMFDEAAAAMRSGHEAKAVRIVTRGMQRPSRRALVPSPLPDAELARLLAALPRPLPSGDPWNEYVLVNLLVHARAYREAAEFGAESYARLPQPLLAATIARAAGGLGDEATAIAWLRAAAQHGPAAGGVAALIDRAPELAAVRHHPEVVEMRAALATVA